MSQAYSFQINRPAHQRRCRAALEQYQVSGPQLPGLGDRPRRIVGSRGETRVLTASGHYVSID